MTRGVGAALWFAGALLLGGTQMGGCKDSSGSGSSSTGLGANTPLNWLDTSSTGGGTVGDSPMLWNDPQTGPAATPPSDPSDIRTYTNPDIYQIGNKHPLMTQVTSATHPYIIGPENGLTKYIQDFRYNEWVKLTGNPPARGAKIDEFVMLRQIARAHCKDFAVWHPNLPFTDANPHGDSLLQDGVYFGDGVGYYFSVTIFPDGVSSNAHNLPPIEFASDGRIPKCRLQVLNAGQLVLSGTGYMDPFNVFAFWITNNRQFILWTDSLNGQTWTHLGVGYWRAPGTALVHYWGLVMATNPQAVNTAPGGGFPLPFP
jgi:hypothetical protein